MEYYTVVEMPGQQLHGRILMNLSRTIGMKKVMHEIT